MSLNRISGSLVFSCTDGRNISAKALHHALGGLDSEVIGALICGQGKWRNARVDFFEIAIESFCDEDEPYEVFHSRLMGDLSLVSDWLIGQNRSLVEEFSRDSVRVFFLFDCAIDQDQIELELPPVFLLALAELRIGIHIISND